jgi:23S rRNA pseudouridine1911/1915/1917 synthase
MCVTELNSRPAVTHIKVLERYSGFTYVRCALETGRTHQIRVHMAYIGHPLAGDDVYGPAKVIAALGGQCLHAYQLGFVHPVTGEYMEFTSEPPESFLKFREKLRNGQLRM